MAGEDDLVTFGRNLFDSLGQHCECCPYFGEQLQGLSGGRPSSVPTKKRKTLHISGPQDVSSNSSQGEIPKRARAKRPRKNAAADWFLENAPKATEWRKRQTELGLNTAEQYEQVIRAFTDRTNVLVEREPCQEDEHQIIDSAKRFPLFTRDFLTNAKLEKSFASFQVLILLSYCEVLRKRSVPQETLESIVQHISPREVDRRSLLKSALWVNGVIVALASHGWTIYRATELFFINALSITSLIHIHNHENSQLILENLKEDKFVKHDYSDCLKPEYSIPGLIASLLNASTRNANQISLEGICASLGYNSDCVPKSTESIYQVHATSKSTPVTLLNLDFEVLGPNSFQSNDGPLISLSKYCPTIRASDPHRLHTEGSGQQSMAVANVAPDERATITSSTLERSISDSAEPQTVVVVSTDQHPSSPNQDSVAITPPAYQVSGINPASRALVILLSFFGQSKIPERLLERARGPLLTWGKNGEVEEQQVNTVEVVQNKLVYAEAIKNFHQLKAIHLEQSTDGNRYISLDPQVLAQIAHREDHMRWRIEAVKVVLYAFPVDRRLQPLYSFSIATSVLPLLNYVLPYLEEVVVEKALPAAHVIEVCLSASYYSTLDWKTNVIAIAERIGTRFPVADQLRDRVALRKKILYRISSCNWEPEVEHLEVTRVDQRSNGYYGEFVLFNADVLYGRQQLQAAFDELDGYTAWHPGNVSTLEQFQICEMNFLRGKIHHFSGHFSQARVWLEQVLQTKRAEASMICKAIAHLTAVYCELGETQLGIGYASTQLDDLTVYQSRESGSAKRLRLALAYAYLMQGMWAIFAQPFAGYISLQRDDREAFDKAQEFFQALARSYENTGTLSRANKTNRFSTLLGVAVIAHIKDDLHEACRRYDIALDAAKLCKWKAGYIEAIIYWSKSVVLQGLGKLEEARRLNGLAGTLYQCRSYFFVGFGTLWPEIIGAWAAQQGGERIIPRQVWERESPERSQRRIYCT